MKDVWNTLRDFFPHAGEERCVVMEELNHHVECTEARVHRVQKYVKLVRRRSFPTLHALAKSSAFKKCDRLMVACASRHATTVEGNIHLRRDHPERSIDESELDTLLFHGLWEFLNRYRAWAAKKMGVNELELVLANAEILDARLGTHKIFNPSGFSGKDFTVRLRGTFVPRTLLPLFEKLGQHTRDLYIMEYGSALTNAVAGENDFVVHVEKDHTIVFVSKQNERFCLGEYSWGTASVARALMAHLAIDEVSAEWMMMCYKKKELSDRFRRLVEKHTRDEFQRLWKLLDPLYAKSKDTKPITHFHFRFEVPLLETLFGNAHSHLATFHERIKLEGIRVEAIRNQDAVSPLFDQTMLALLLHPHTVPQYAFLNQLLRRRAKWLIPHRT